jgi:hypothetical protein
MACNRKRAENVGRYRKYKLTNASFGENDEISREKIALYRRTRHPAKRVL